MDTASILKDYYAHHNPQLATDAEVARICKALRLRAEQREGLTQSHQISDYIFRSVAEKNGTIDPRKWVASQKRSATEHPKQLTAAAIKRHDAERGVSTDETAAAAKSSTSGRRSTTTAGTDVTGGTGSGSSSSVGGPSKSWNVSTHDGNAKKKMSYFTYNKLVGDADGGTELPPEQFEELVDRYHSSWEDGSRLYITWACAIPGRERECIRCKPNFACMCGHKLNAHSWFDKSTRCRAPACKCGAFRYLHRQGSFSIRCKCKHDAVDHSHSGQQGPCTKVGCECGGFSTNFACQCGASWNEHTMVVETEAERREAGKPTDRESHLERRRAQQRAKNGCGKCTNCKNLFGACLKGVAVTDSKYRTFSTTTNR